ncbi:endonuclease/exonuclease/phosphatase family protein [Microvirga terricola]|uniref:Endonuclease/exonuclease/phosphatase family protein n=1 Tax=Microvirga terricola TaxID=2719797 RepID=A0ABX0VB40_9HYPH|nr:endonuclease/exonuclease/phosphatase family protein [Microvirga terricola]NIX76882.1 endonuclease/exonuclease/phosphatase family protein [Microvirga terricola]
MRPLITTVVRSLDGPGNTILAQASEATPSKEEHSRFITRIGALHAIEQEPPSRPIAWPGRLRVAAFNAERMKSPPAAARALLDRAGAQVALLSEVDVGMARSGNVHTVRALTAPTGEGHLYGVEFVELGLGDSAEMKSLTGARNAESLHGNAIVTALTLTEPRLIPLEETGFWFAGREGAQKRVGSRMALAARVADAPRPLWVVSVHLESKTDPADRQAQMRTLLRALDHFAPHEACVIGGDLNTKALPTGEGERSQLLENPERFEPLFADLRDAGFEWAHANVAAPTQRTGPGGKPMPPFGKIDWILTRGLRAENPAVVPALDEQDRPISDHEMVAVDLLI